MLFHTCRVRPGEGQERRRGRELPVVVLLGPRGSGKTAMLGHLGFIASRRPHALYDFGSDAAVPRSPYEVAARCALGLSHGFPRQPRVRFPSLALGLLVVRTGISLDEAEPRRARAELRAALRQARESGADDGAQQAGAALTLLQDLNLLQLPGMSLLTSLVQRGLPRLPVEVMWHTGLSWYRDQSAYRRIDALLALKERGESQDAGDRRAVDRMLCAAFIEDLRAHYARHPGDRASVLLLDNIDRGEGRAFLDLLVEIREENASESATRWRTCASAAPTSSSSRAAGRGRDLPDLLAPLKGRPCDGEVTVLSGDDLSQATQQEGFDEVVAALRDGDIDLVYTGLAHSGAWEAAEEYFDPDATAVFRDGGTYVTTFSDQGLGDGQAIMGYDVVRTAVKAIRATGNARDVVASDVFQQLTSRNDRNAIPGASGYIFLRNDGSPDRKAIPVIRVDESGQLTTEAVLAAEGEPFVTGHEAAGG
ncbi:hypothetical protein [Streptomyces sp. PT12]|uniref:hypothetical protein n=1 Tax=Streptomyces sp. PT12 TaxID=1510197 RepID=UPI000DE46438|nr:hypothetical protein [Streptomyces sp. PT12]RBM18708.1 hypothetical protein DEH69_12470 [Streptomyces sp. PT12]